MPNTDTPNHNADHSAVAAASKHAPSGGADHGDAAKPAKAVGENARPLQALNHRFLLSPDNRLVISPAGGINPGGSDSPN